MKWEAWIDSRGIDFLHMIFIYMKFSWTVKSIIFLYLLKFVYAIDASDSYYILRDIACFCQWIDLLQPSDAI